MKENFKMSEKYQEHCFLCAFSLPKERGKNCVMGYFRTFQNTPITILFTQYTEYLVQKKSWNKFPYICFCFPFDYFLSKTKQNTKTNNPVPLLFQMIYSIFFFSEDSGNSEPASARLLPLGGAQREAYWIKVKSKTLLGHGGSRLSFRDLRRVF